MNNIHTEPHPTEPSTSFQVDDVPLKNQNLNTRPVREVFLKNAGRKPPIREGSMTDLMGSPPEDPYTLAGCSYDGNVVDFGRERANPVLAAVHTAFEKHLPLVFSPDIIWQTILQGVAQHIANHSEKLRDKIVGFEGRKKLTIFRPDLSLGNITQIGRETPSIVTEFNGLIDKEVTAAYANVFKETFSTTTLVESTAARIACMDAFSAYFHYEMICGCGFPRITLLGTPDDWRKIRAKIDEIQNLFHVPWDDRENHCTSLDWWTPKLKIVLDQFILASEGKPDIAFWKKLYKQIDMYLAFSFNGWIGWLWPYVKEQNNFDAVAGKWIDRNGFTIPNPMLTDISNTVWAQEGSSWSSFSEKYEKEAGRLVTFNDSNQRHLTLNSFTESYTGSCFMSTGDFPLGISKADLHIKDIATGDERDTVLVGGFIGVTQDKDTFALMPKIGYGLLV